MIVQEKTDGNIPIGTFVEPAISISIRQAGPTSLTTAFGGGIPSSSNTKFSRGLSNAISGE
jgi:hypothetical protein